MGAHRVASATSGANRSIRKSPELLTVTSRNSPRSTEATLEIAAGAISDVAIQGIAVDFIVPMVVDRIIERIVGYATATDIWQAPGYCEHNNPGEHTFGEKKSEGRTATETSPPKADAEASTVADGCGIQGTERVRHAAEFDGK
jgi:hypothetical protein